jgi:Ca2+-binding RTX toxin-like protein
MAIRIGNRHNNTLNGTNGTDLLIGNDGDDILNGGAGLDLLFGGDDNDTLNGGAGSDLVFGDSGDDIFIFTRRRTPTAATSTRAAPATTRCGWN